MLKHQQSTEEDRQLVQLLPRHPLGRRIVRVVPGRGKIGEQSVTILPFFFYLIKTEGLIRIHFLLLHTENYLYCSWFDDSGSN